MAKKQPDKLNWILTDMLELPKDLVLELPRITLIGQRELYLENHKGIIEYDSNQIKINLVRGYLEIEGLDMEIKFIIHDELSISGNIKALRFVE